ncbi:phosphoribosylanthranilate isomerase [Pelagicoccus sp. SDUM812005]|uniref:phosphoribosylanthranilate isomerase n=1 Tax=Pelagicoccus sp. SDUM812005 TaxID=3041257 RepID=UPI00280F0B13|nr:phosphoribosylanthranilate isomerase [Pelagicoccus sp. SDUM812005]MDQ8179974.1 phosphoribosylanthranilate isomerase [Pelagicoccus sp. SDUM812005]
MVNGIQFKVCGLTRARDAQAAAEAGADYLGFIFYPKSPRGIRLERYRDILPRLPEVPKVAVTVAPDLYSLAQLEGLGFDKFQIHFPIGIVEEVEGWSKLVGKERLWLAPKMAPGVAFDPLLLQHASGILWDAFKQDQDTYGGTGTKSDWGSFADNRKRYPEAKWILAGGISPENAAEALVETGADVLDFNSSLEIEPGLKDLERISQVRVSLSEAAMGNS